MRLYDMQVELREPTITEKEKVENEVTALMSEKKRAKVGESFDDLAASIEAPR